MKLTKLTLLGILILASLSSCISIQISSLQTPDTLVPRISEFRGSEVVVQGRVRARVTIPGTSLSVYQLEGRDQRITVFGTSSRDNGDRVRIPARVYQLGSSEGGSGAIRNFGEFTRMLRQEEILSGAAADLAANLIMEAIRLISSASQQIYFLVEQ